MSHTQLTCREILEKLSEYIDEDLDPSMCDQIEEHMSGCSPCVAFVNTLKKTVKLVNTAGNEVIVPEEVRGKLHDFLRSRCRGEEK